MVPMQLATHLADTAILLQIDLKDVNLSVGERHLLVDAHLRVKAGIKYGFVAPNGSGKSSECQRGTTPVGRV